MHNTFIQARSKTHEIMNLWQVNLQLAQRVYLAGLQKHPLPFLTKP